VVPTKYLLKVDAQNYILRMEMAMAFGVNQQTVKYGSARLAKFLCLAREFFPED